MASGQEFIFSPSEKVGEIHPMFSKVWTYSPKSTPLLNPTEIHLVSASVVAAEHPPALPNLANTSKGRLSGSKLIVTYKFPHDVEILWV